MNKLYTNLIVRLFQIRTLFTRHIQCNDVILITCLSLLFLLIRGYAYGRVNHVSFIPAIYRLADPTFLAGDWYITSLISYHYPFNLFYSTLIHLIKLPILFFISYCLTLMLYIISIKKLSIILFKHNGPFYILFVLLMGWRNYGIEANALIHNNNFEAMFLAPPIAILAIAYFFENKMNKAFIFSAITTIVHILIGVNLFIILILCYIILYIRKPIQSMKKIFIPVLLYLIISSWQLIPALINAFKRAVDYKQFYINYLWFREPHHFILSTWGIGMIIFGLLCLLGLICLMKKEKGEIDKKSVIFVTIVLIGILIQYIFIEIIPIDFFARFHFYRMSIFVTMIAFMYIANYLYNIIDRSILFFLIAIIFIFGNDPLFGIMLVLLIELIFKKRYKILFFLIAVAAILTLTSDFLFIKATNYLCMFPFIPVILAVLLGTLLYFLRSIEIKKLKYNIVFIPLIILSVFTISTHIKEGLCYNINIHLTPQNKWEKLCFWIKDNTPQEDFFITPPYLYGFHLYAERSLLVDYKVPPVIETDIFEWKKRLEDVFRVDDVFSFRDRFRRYEFFKERYNSLSEEEIKHLGEKYNADYIIFEKPKQLLFEVQYETKDYIIYKIPVKIVKGLNNTTDILLAPHTNLWVN